MQLKTIPRFAALAVALLAAVPQAWGHGIDMFARVEGTQIVGSMRYADGTPVSEVVVRAFAPDGMVMEEVHTDESGQFTMPIRFQVRYRLVGDAGEGHRGLFTVSEQEISNAVPARDLNTAAAPGADGLPGRSENSPAAIDTTMLETAIARQLGPLRDQLHDHETRVRFRDILGGIGYVFGLAGVYVLLKRRRSPADSGSDS